MAFEFKLPDIGEGVVEGEIVAWLVNEGDVINEDQPVVEVLTDKATVVIPSPKAGKVTSLPWNAGDTVPVGKTLVVIDAGADDSVDTPPAEEPAPEAAPPPAVEETVEVPAAPVATTDPTPPSAPATGATRVLAAPATRRIAREKGVDIQSIQGTGKGGRVTRDDVERAASGGSAPATQPTAAPKRTPVATDGPREERIPLKGLRKIIAENMVKSKFTAPHFTYVEEIDVTELVALRKRLRPIAQQSGTDLSFLPIIMKAVVIMLREHPMLNASLLDETNEIVLKRYYNLGVAVATDNGLTVPVVHDVENKGILDLAQEVTELADKARAMRLSQDDIRDSTFTITSLGKLGGILATPILNPGEVAILGVHRIFERPAFVDGQVVPRQLMNVSLSFDHRVVDGFVGAVAVQRLRELLENPDRFLLELR